jgi:hypothetical protein
MDRNSERGQMMIELLVLVLMFAGLFLIAVTLTESGEQSQKPYRFSKSQAHSQAHF